MDITVVKENGEKEEFSPKKVRHALRRTGLSQTESDEVLHKLHSRLYNGITTKRIYGMVYDLVEEMKPEVSHRYNLKRALFDIGPEGYGFEDFTSRLLSLQGHRTEVRQIIEGKCVSHEIDVVADKGKEGFMVECKFHNQYGTRCRIQTALYVYARFLDLQAGAKIGRCRKFTKPWLVTNTKFSEDVIRYAECMGFPLLGWRYPLRKGLEVLIDRKKCYPVTVIPMPRDTIRRMLHRDIVTVYDIPESPQKLAEKAAIPLKKAKEIVEKAAYAR